MGAAEGQTRIMSWHFNPTLIASTSHAVIKVGKLPRNAKDNFLQSHNCVIYKHIGGTERERDVQGLFFPGWDRWDAFLVALLSDLNFSRASFLRNHLQVCLDVAPGRRATEWILCTNTTVELPHPEVLYHWCNLHTTQSAMRWVISDLLLMKNEISMPKVGLNEVVPVIHIPLYVARMEI